MIISTIFMLGFKPNEGISEGKIEEAARGLGMHYNNECKVLFEKEKTND